MLIKSIVLGIIQGLTEFLPVSSSGHLALFESIFNIHNTNLFLETSMHFGTLIALLIFFRKKIFELLKNAYNEIAEKKEDKENIRFIIYIIIGIIPAAIAGLFLYDFIKGLFTNMIFVSVFFFITSFFLYFTKFFNAEKELNYKNSFFIGIMQIFALLPGISRSGITISSGLILKIKPEKAADFSFFMAIPLILASFLKELLDVKFQIDFNIIVATIAAFISGYIAIIFLYKILKSDKFYVFSLYVFIMGIITLIYGIAK